MQLKPLHQSHCQALLAFERTNKDWFEKFIPPRPAELLTEEGMANAIASLLEEQEAGTCYMCVIYDNDEIIGRANLNAIHVGTGDLGYRIAQKAIGKGIATQAVSELMAIARDELNLSLLTARTTHVNEASQAVLKKLGFHETHRENGAADLNGESLDLLHFECRLK